MVNKLGEPLLDLLLADGVVIRQLLPSVKHRLRAHGTHITADQSYNMFLNMSKECNKCNYETPVCNMLYYSGSLQAFIVVHQEMVPTYNWLHIIA